MSVTIPTSLLTPAMKLPTGLDHAANGKLSASYRELVSIGNGQELHSVAARSWASMWIAARADGIELTVVPGGAYRSLYQQETVFYERNYVAPVPGPSSVVYKGSRWTLRPKMARVAVPGHSNHGLGLALDVGNGSRPALARPLDDASQRWLIANVESFGWAYELRSEPWHIRFVNAVVTQRTIDIERFLAAVAKP
jgi:LAS superfamily LD-carboxypeptidase LdcB